ncbi:hypothetical protein [Bryobacter aggregatus]|uniref:hypothetical protein n=1 Tax=Bryobacter aggregatus TaxID=360054 RepID=UPI0004E1181C|nr:hypothetical protein [Bryobacter aggregatus]
MNAFLTQSAMALFLSISTLGAADISGLWMGQLPGRFEKTEDIAFQLKLEGTKLSGKLFGDEIDLPLEEGSVVGDKVNFTITTTNYYSGEKVQTRYSGLLQGNEIELTRERVPTATEKTANAKPAEKPKPFHIKRLTRGTSPALPGKH